MDKLNPAKNEEDKIWINNYRMGGYLLFACGLINLRYQWGKEGIEMSSAKIFIPGALIITATFIPAALKVLARREVKFLVAVLGLALVAFAITN
jgi:hypothetical protein